MKKDILYIGDVVEVELPIPMSLSGKTKKYSLTIVGIDTNNENELFYTGKTSDGKVKHFTAKTFK